MMNLTDLNWNIHTKALWASRKPFFEEKIRGLKWESVVDGKILLPPQAALQLTAYIKKAEIKKVLEVSYNMQTPMEIVYGLKAQYSNGTATVYLVSNMQIIQALATKFTKKIILLNEN